MLRRCAIAVLVDRAAGDEFHHHVRPAVRSHAAIQQLGDIGVIEMRQDLPLVLEALQDVVGIHAALDHFDGDQLAELIVVAHALVDHAHAALADLLHDLVDAQLLAGIRAFAARAGARCRKSPASS